MHRVSVLIKDTEWELVAAAKTTIGAADCAKLSATSSVKSPELRWMCSMGLPGTMCWATWEEPVNWLRHGNAPILNSATEARGSCRESISSSWSASVLLRKWARLSSRWKDEANRLRREYVESSVVRMTQLAAW